jgi:nicotinamide riboside kinase
MKHTSPSRRVVVTGSECTGKTALTASLAQYFDCPSSPEGARLYVEQHNRPLTVDDVNPIASLQAELEEVAIRKARGLVIHDTDLVSPAWITRTASERAADLYLLCDIDLPWVSDGLQRDSGLAEQRRQIHEKFVEAMTRSGLRWTLIRGLGEKRLEQAVRAIKALA